MNVNDLKILICDDSLLSRKKLKDCISKLNCASIYEAADGEEAVSSFRDNRPDIVFMDIIMPKKDGIEALKEILELDPDATVVMASSVGTQSYLNEAIRFGASDFLQKPIDPMQVKSYIDSYCTREDF